MKKIVYITTACLLVGACVGKQGVDDRYYRKTTWAKGSENLTIVDNSAVQNKTRYASSSANSQVPSSRGADVGEKWQDPQAVQQMAVPVAAEKKIQCTKKGDAYTCRYGQTVCGTGCRADGSNCYDGYCLKSECDNVMGQKWDWVKVGGNNGTNYYGCKHPTYNVTCFPYDSDGITCITDTRFFSEYCGKQCNKNGTDCGQGPNNCWDKYR